MSDQSHHLAQLISFLESVVDKNAKLSVDSLAASSLAIIIYAEPLEISILQTLQLADIILNDPLLSKSKIALIDPKLSDGSQFLELYLTNRNCIFKLFHSKEQATTWLES